MKYYACLPDKCLAVLKQLQIDLTMLNNFQDTLKQINVIKYFPNAINNATRFREILLRYLGYYASEWRIYRVIKDQIHGGPQRVSFVILQQLNAEAEHEFVTLSSQYKHLDLENAQTTLLQSMTKSVRVQQQSVYQSQRLKPKENKQNVQLQQQQNVPQMNQQVNQQMNQQQMQYQQQMNEYYQQHQQYYQQQANEIQQLKSQIEQLQQVTEDEKQKRKLLQQQWNEDTKRMKEIQTENSQLKQQVSELQSKEKSSRSKDDKKMKEFQAEKMRIEKEMNDIRNENELLKRQIENEKRKYEDQFQQMKTEKTSFENSLIEEKQINQQLRNEIALLKQKVVDTDTKEETKEFNIPLQNFYEGTPFVFEHRGLQFSIPTLGQMENEKRYVYNGYGTPLNGQPRDLVVVSRIYDDGEYEREGYNLIKKVYYDRNDAGKEKILEIVLPNMVIQPFTIYVSEGMFEVQGFGLLNKEGQRGSLVIDVKLI